MNESDIGIGVTGSGFMGRTHVDAAARINGANPIAVTGGSRAEKLASDYSISHIESTKALVARDDVDAIVISTPHYCHIDEARLALQSGKHVLIEKPLTTSLEDADELGRLAKEKGLVLSVGYHQRFRESNWKTRDLIQSGAIGTIRCIQTAALFDITSMRQKGGFGGAWSWWTDPRSIAHLINSAPHTIDLCRWWMDTELTRVSAISETLREPDNPNENTTMALLHFENGAMASFWSSSVAPNPGFAGEEFRFRIMGDEGLIDLDPYHQLRLCRDEQWEVVFEQPSVGHDSADSAFSMNRMGAYCDQMSAFVSSIHGKPGGEGTFDDGRAGVAAVLAMLESSKQQTGVSP